jgi:hypothetical protein
VIAGMNVEVLAELHIFNMPEYKKKKREGFWNVVSLCVHTSLAPERLDRFYSCSVFKSYLS